MLDPLPVLIQQTYQAISAAQQALAQKQEEEAQVRWHCEEIRVELQPIYETAAKVLAECSLLGEEHPAYLTLKTQWEQIQALYENPEPLALDRYRAQQTWVTVSEEELRAEERAIEEEIKNYDLALVEDILQTIQQTEPYLNAADLAIEVDYHRRKLKANGVFEQVVDALLARLNALDRSDKPPKQVLGSHDATLEWMVRFAWSQRHSGTILPVPLRKASRKRDKQPFEYADIAGRVVIFGGHRQMEVKVRSYLGDRVKLLWFSPDDVSATTVSDRAEVIQGADVAIVVTPYLSHKFQNIVKETCKRYAVNLDYCNHTGYRALLEIITEKLTVKPPTELIEEVIPDSSELAEAKLNAFAQMYSRRGR